MRLIRRRVVSQQISFDSLCVVTHQQSAQHTLFRGNTVLTKTIESLMGWYGKSFLEASVGTTIRRLCLDNVSIEVDPLRNVKGPKVVERNVDLLVYWCREIWEQIYSVRQQCPEYVPFPLRRIFPHSGLVKCVNCSGTFESWWRGIILRGTACHVKVSQRSVFSGSLYQPSFIHISLVYARVCFDPLQRHHIESKVSGLPDLPVQRSLTLIAKVIQSLANLNTVCPNVPLALYQD